MRPVRGPHYRQPTKATNHSRRLPRVPPGEARHPLGSCGEVEEPCADRRFHHLKANGEGHCFSQVLLEGKDVLERCQRCARPRGLG